MLEVVLDMEAKADEVKADDDARWRIRAAKARAKANEMKDPENRIMMLQVAALYDGLAERAERRG
jgi:hypothetical protein